MVSKTHLFLPSILPLWIATLGSRIVRMQQKRVCETETATTGNKHKSPTMNVILAPKELSSNYLDMVPRLATLGRY